MKKILLAVFTLALFAGLHAQGLGPSGFEDDFATDEEYGDSTGGVFWWGEDDLEGGNNAGFQALFARSVGSISYTVTQPFNSYIPFGVGFGGADDDPAYIDLSTNSSYELIATNDGDSTILVRLAIQDANENLIDTDARWADGDSVNGNAWKYVIDMDLEPGETDTLKVGKMNGSGTPEGLMTGDFEGGFYADYAQAPFPLLTQDVDFTQIKGFNITIVNKNNTGEQKPPSEIPAFAPFALVDYPVTINYFKVGDAPVGLSELLGNDANAFAVYPNPAKDIVNFPEVKENVQVINAQGMVVKTFSEAKSISTADLDKGIYMIHTSAGYARLIVE